MNDSKLITKNTIRHLLILIAVSLSIIGCQSISSDDLASPTPIESGGKATAPSITVSPAPTPTETVVFVAAVNGEEIPLSSLQATLGQLEAAEAETGSVLKSGENALTKALDNLIERLLLAQAAREGGFSATPEIVEQRFNKLTEQAGGSEKLGAWLAANGYTPESFRGELALEIEATWQREWVAASVPETADQVRARQVLFQDTYLATRAYTQLLSGATFDTIVANNDPFHKGYLDWFPRGYLIFPEVEEVAFSLLPGEFSDVLEIEIGFVIVEVIDRDPARLLSADARLTLQIQALETWLATQRQQSQIEIYTP